MSKNYCNDNKCQSNKFANKQQTRTPIKATEAEEYGYVKYIHGTLDLSTLKDHFPSLPVGQRKKFDLGDRVIAFNTHAIKVFAGNVFKGDDYDEPFGPLETAFQQVSCLFTRKFGRVLDYELPELDAGFFTKLQNSIRPRDPEFCTSKQSEFYLIVDPADKEFVPARTFYTVYRSFVPIVDVSDIEINKLVMLKIYSNILLAEAKCKLIGGEKLSKSDYENIDGLIYLLNFYYEKSSHCPMARALVKAALMQRLSSIGNFLTQNTSFIKPDDVFYFDDEYDGYETIDYNEFIENLAAREVMEDEQGLRTLMIKVIEIIRDYKAQRYSFMKYDAAYRRLMMNYLRSEYGASFTSGTTVVPESAKLDERARTQIILNLIPEVSKEINPNMSPKHEADLLKFNRSVVIDVVLDHFQNHERCGAVAFPFIEKHLVNNAEFVKRLGELDYTAGKPSGAIALVNLFKLAAFTNNQGLYDLFVQKNEIFCKSAGREIFFGIADNQYILLVDKLFHNIRAVFNRNYPERIMTFLKNSADFYKQHPEKHTLLVHVECIMDACPPVVEQLPPVKKAQPAKKSLPPNVDKNKNSKPPRH